MCTVGNLNGTRCRDGVKVLLCHSHLVWLVFLLFFVLLFRNSKRERWEGRLKGRCVSIKYDNIQLRTIIKLAVNPNNGGVEAQAKPRAP